MSASLPKLPGVFVCVSSPKRTDARLGRAPGRNEPSSPQLANSKQIKLSLVPAQLFHGARWGTGAFGESKRIWAGPLKGGSGADFRGPGCCCQDGTGPGAWDCSHHLFSSPHLAAGKLGQGYYLVWSQMGLTTQLPQGKMGIAVESHLIAPQISSSSFGAARLPALPFQEVM